MSKEIVQLNEEVIKGQLKELVRGVSVKHLLATANPGAGWDVVVRA